MNGLRRNDDDQSNLAGIQNIPQVAIVILNWNGKHFLQQFLPSVLNSTYQNKRVIVADNASTDDSITFLQQYFPQVEIIKNTTNEGFAKGYNTVLQQVKADYFVLLNSDVEVTPNWIEPIVELMEGDKLIAACQPKLLAFNDKNKFEYAGASGGWIDFLGYPFMRGRIFDDCENDEGQYNTAQQCFWASGAALFVKASVYKELKGLDEYFFAHQEEIDFCWRAQLKGYKIFAQPQSVVYHVGGGTLHKGSGKKTFLNFRNNLILLFKNLPFAKLLWVLPCRFFLDAVSAYKELFNGNTTYFFAIAKAHFGFLYWVFFGKKYSLFEQQSNKVLVGKLNKSIVWAYFVKKQKTFAQIVDSK
ncbi:MAG: glycosyltransferase family 2 protein [Ferruginibacter sp.]|nr:glycosyltransferase family 2 protein [Ferruginibacter sp.]